MAATICLLNPTEAEMLRNGKKLNCRHHRHAGKNYANDLVSGRKPGFESYWGDAEKAELPDGTRSKKHLVMNEAKEWRKVFSGLVPVMQLVSIRRRGRKSLG